MVTLIGLVLDTVPVTETDMEMEMVGVPGLVMVPDLVTVTVLVTETVTVMV